MKCISLSYFFSRFKSLAQPSSHQLCKRTIKNRVNKQTDDECNNTCASFRELFYPPLLLKSNEP